MENIEIWPIIGLVIFFVCFLVVLIRVLRTDKKYNDKMKNLPFNESPKTGKENS